MQSSSFRVVLIAIVCTTFVIPIDAMARPSRGGARTSVHQGSVNRGSTANRGRSANTNVNRNANYNRNVNSNRNYNVNRNVNVDVDHGYYGGGYGYRGGAVAAGVAAGVTAAAIGSIAYSLPSSCTTIVTNGVTYQQCGSTYYEPRYSGSSVSYVVVTPP